MDSPTRTPFSSRSRTGAARGSTAPRTGRRRTLVPLVGALLAVLATGCGGGAHTYSTSETKVDVHVGDTFTLTADENGTLPWRWYVDTPKPDASVVRSTGDHHKDGADDDPKEMGADDGHHLFTFKATGKGSTKIILLYCNIVDYPAGPASVNSPSPTPSSPTPSPTYSVSRAPTKTVTYTVTVS